MMIKNCGPQDAPIAMIKNTPIRIAKGLSDAIATVGGATMSVRAEEASRALSFRSVFSIDGARRKDIKVGQAKTTTNRRARSPYDARIANAIARMAVANSTYRMPNVNE